MRLTLRDGSLATSTHAVLTYSQDSRNIDIRGTLLPWMVVEPVARWWSLHAAFVSFGEQGMRMRLPFIPRHRFRNEDHRAVFLCQQVIDDGSGKGGVVYAAPGGALD